MERYGRYFYGKEINEINTQYIRTETAEYNRHIMSNYPEPTNLHRFGYHDFNRQALQGSFNASRANHYNGVDGYYGTGSESNTLNDHGYGNPKPVVNSIGSLHRDFNHPAIQGSFDASRANHYNGVDGYYGTGSESNTLNNHGYGNPKPVVNSIGSLHRDFNHPAIQGSFDASRANHYNGVDGYYGTGSESNTLNNHGYGNPKPVVNSIGSLHRDFNYPAIQGSFDASRASHYNDDRYYAAGPSESITRNHHGYENPQAVVNSFESRHPDFNRQAIHQRNISSVHDNISNEIDQTTNFAETELSKLIKRIKKYYEDLVPLIYSKNIDLFDKRRDWIKLSFIECNGMKIFQAQMICPICLGTVTPQNKEKEAGRVPKWELHSVKRHVINVHMKKKKIQEKENNESKTVAKEEEIIGKIENNDTETVVKEENIEKVEKIELLDVEIKPSEKKEEPLDDEKVEKLSGTSDFVSYFSLAASASSDSKSSDSDEHSDSKTDTEKSIEKKRNSVGTGSKRQSSERKSYASKRQNAKRKCYGNKRQRSDRKSSGSKRKIEIQSSSSSESEQEPAWKKPGVTFGWVKLTTVSRFQPAFIFPKRKNEKKHSAQYIQAKGTLSDFIHPVEFVATPEEVELAKISKKSYNHVCAIKKFNALNGTKF